MILTGSEIAKERKAGVITLFPFSEEMINPNSYNYRLGPTLKEFDGFDGKKSHFKEFKIPGDGFVLKPKQLYLANTLERIGSTRYSVSLIGRSSIGRLGLFVQHSANLGHVGVSHCWTLELFATLPVMVYPGMKIGQVSFWENTGDLNYYDGFYGNFSSPHESILPDQGVG